MGSGRMDLTAGAAVRVSQEPPEIFPDGVPEKWMVKDIGPATIEQLRPMILPGSEKFRCDGFDLHGTSESLTLHISRFPL